MASKGASHRIMVSLSEPIYDWLHQQAEEVGCSDSAMCQTLVIEAKRNRDMLIASTDMVHFLRGLTQEQLEKALSMKDEGQE